MLRPYVVERGKRFGVNRKKSVIRKKHFHIKSKSEKAGEKQLFLPQLLRMYIYDS